jgi:hypothetical protein
MEAQVQPSVIGTQRLPFEVVALVLQGGVTAPRICQMSAGPEGHGAMNSDSALLFSFTARRGMHALLGHSTDEIQ